MTAKPTNVIGSTKPQELAIDTYQPYSPVPDEPVPDQPGSDQLVSSGASVSDQRTTRSGAVYNANTTISNTATPAQASSSAARNNTSAMAKDNSNQRAPTELIGMPDEVLVSIVNHMVLPRFDTHDPVGFPEPRDGKRLVMDTNHKIRTLTLEITTKEILFIDMRFCLCNCQPARWRREHYLWRLQRLWTYLSLTFREKLPVAHERTHQNHIGKPVSTLQIDIGRHRSGRSAGEASGIPSGDIASAQTGSKTSSSLTSCRRNCSSFDA